MEKKVIGSNANIVLESFPEKIHCKVDTGAQTNSIHCDGCYKEEGVLYCRILNSEEYIKFEKYKIKNVRSSNGIRNSRYCVKLKFNLNGKKYTSEFTLNDRSKMKYPVLLGKNFLSSRFTVDVDR